MGTKKDIKAKGPKMGMRKHGKSGYSVNIIHFTGKKAGKPQRRKGNRRLNRKQRKQKMNSHQNKYK